MSTQPLDAWMLPDRGPGWWSITELKDAATNVRLRRLLVLWGLVILVAIVTGILNVQLGWNGLTLEWAGLSFDFTLYPSFVLSVLLALWLGPVWGAVPIYLANAASGIASGMSIPMSLLFAVAGVVETLMLWGSLVALRVDVELRRKRDMAWFVAAGLVAAVTGSLAAILWNASHGLDPLAGQRIWRGWVLGDMAQLILVVMPLLRLAGPRVRSWVDRQFVNPPHHDFSYLHGVGLTVAAFAVLCLVVFLGVHQALGPLEIAIDTKTATGDLLLPRLREIILSMGLLSTALIVATGLFSTALARMGERQRREAALDSLTRCHNRRAFASMFEREAERSRRLGLGLGLLVVDVDRVKAINDAHGHEAGDLALERLARRIEATLRGTDLLFRWGGEEFVVLMPHTHAEEVGEVAERVRQAVDREPLATLTGGLILSATVSIGAVSTSKFPADAASLVGRADEACYRAKKAGRNRVEVVG